jgi:signal transduction histidine kinase
MESMKPERQYWNKPLKILTPILFLLATTLLLSLFIWNPTVLIQKPWILMIYLTLSLTCGIVYLLAHTQEAKREWRTLIDMLENLIQGEDLSVHGSDEDTLLSLAHMKIRRISTINQSRAESLRKDKQALQEVVSDTAHQIGTPMANLKLCLARLQEDLPSRTNNSIGVGLAGLNASQNTMETMAAMESQVDKLEFLLSSLVRLSRLETALIVPRVVTGNLYDTLAQALSSTPAKALEKQITVRVDCPEELYVEHDPRWTAEALFNIIDNALKYSENNGEIHITAGRNECFTTVEIRDSGRGIAEDEIGLIFNRFYRSNRSDDQPGMGLGLHVAKRIIEAQQGSITVTSQVGKGSQFIVRLPNVSNM